MARKVLFNYFLVQAFSNLSISFIFASYVIFLMDRGMDLLQINLINMSFMATIFFFEVPTGVFADLLGRKKSYIICHVLMIFSTLIYGLSNYFWLFILAEVMCGIAHTFASGAMDAYLVDNLHFFKYQGNLKRIFSFEEILLSTMRIIGGLCGAYIAARNLATPWFVASGGMLLSALLATWLLKEYYPARNNSASARGFNFYQREGYQILKKSLALIKTNRNVRWMILVSCLLSFAVMAPNLQWQPKFKELTGRVEFLGQMWVWMSLGTIAGGLLVRLLDGKARNERPLILLAMITVGLGIFGASRGSNLWIIFSWFILHEIGRGAFRPLQRAYLNDWISGNERATVLSLDSMLSKIGCVSGLLVSGFIAKYFSINYAWFWIGLGLVVTSLIILMKNGWRKK